ncbi:phosphonate C-P lyase system protein PhnH [Methylobacterium sp. 4-46]|uniref:phosphonate C-P lyase system protein PhnH n=1 Tax=unclassified Methylobacterium TaxID=2615210 RepID=UPI000152CBE2|nr:MULTISPECIES: phosphonate C-P lyase system protein PhnH [Methylobacterium]ACA17329.1 phosphonate C-P lyase system protein PhnH [Methylobacterium sp. 4-46]WFT83014.1 phosphonate C-P lyase system protein PhnH [Methylobacterium nodulans]
MTLAPGLRDPVHDAQAVFRAVMDALARPGRIQRLAPDLAPPRPLTPELAAVALALADAEAPLWLDPVLAASGAVADFLRFHTGAPLVVEPAAAQFALVAAPAACPDFAAFAQGEPAYPDRSATLVLACAELAETHPAEEGGLVLEGPGIRARARLRAAPLPPDFAARMRANRAAFPLGLDLLLTAPGRVAGLPRSTRVTEG